MHKPVSILQHSHTYEWKWNESIVWLAFYWVILVKDLDTILLLPHKHWYLLQYMHINIWFLLVIFFWLYALVILTSLLSGWTEYLTDFSTDAIWILRPTVSVLVGFTR